MGLLLFDHFWREHYMKRKLIAIAALFVNKKDKVTVYVIKTKYGDVVACMN